MFPDDMFRQELTELEGQNRLRQTRTFGGLERIHPLDAATGRPILAFCSNDYLGLSSHPDLAQAAARAAHEFGWGSGSARLISGESPNHRELEQALAAFVGAPDALLFPTGYQTNIGVVTTVAGPADLIVSDALNHASIIDGCRLSRAKVAVYRHGDAADAERALSTPGTFRRRVLVTESIFSMDGDRAPLAALASLAAHRQAILVVDEAHALGVAGPGGRGIAAEAKVAPTVVIGTLGKAFGVAGGFAAASRSLRQLLANRARTFIYTTSQPAPVAAAALAALRVITGPDGDERRRHAYRMMTELRRRLSAATLAISGTDLILPVLVGSDRDALDLATRLLDLGILVPAIRPPTVPEGTARLRITVSAAHSPAEIARLADALVTLIPRTRS